jgi:hypothetical protein
MPHECAAGEGAQIINPLGLGVRVTAYRKLSHSLGGFRIFDVQDMPKVSWINLTMPASPLPWLWWI